MKFCISGGVLVLALSSCFARADCNPLLKSTFDRSKVVVESNGTLVDLTTGLMWQRCALGFEWKNNTCVPQDGVPSLFTWEQAIVQAAKSKSFVGFNDWRLPNKNELGSLVDYACFQPSIDASLFPETRSEGYWSNSPNSFTESRAWAINFAYGDHMSSIRADLLNARLVREIPR
ncbi:MAG: hypothetical protein RL497_879 [Pseudomonadota bacterium]|jgi:hypothetical protein